MRGGMQDLATTVLEDEETVKNPESQRGTVKKSKAAMTSPVIVQEGEPALCFFWMTMVFSRSKQRETVGSEMANPRCSSSP